MIAHSSSAFLALAVAVGSAAPPADPLARSAARLARASNAFGLDLHRRLAGGNRNSAFSPASLSTVLDLIWSGARGETAAQMQRVLFLEGTAEEVRVGTAKLLNLLRRSAGDGFLDASALFGEVSFAFEPAFVAGMEDADAPFLGGLDFKGASEQARGLINEWVSEHTRSRTPEIIPHEGIGPLTRLVAVNALSFKESWETPFKKGETRTAPFHVSKADEQLVPMMHDTSKRPFVSRVGLKAVELRYQSGNLSMLLVLPDARDGLATLEASLEVEELDAIVKALRPRKVALSLPQFEVRADSLRLATLLKAMGMTAAFDPRQADFTGIARSEDPRDRLFLGEPYHQAFVKVDENGTEAAAATAGSMITLGMEPEEKAVEFRADHPFLFLIRDGTTGLVVFMGRVTDPHNR